MKHKISLFAFGHASSLFIAITFVTCVVFGLLLPDYAMYGVWLKLLPGFEWLTLKGFIIGLLESYAYGWYITLIWVPLYNYFGKKAQ